MEEEGRSSSVAARPALDWNEEDDEDENGWRPRTKNKWRFQSGSDDKIIEILMIHDHITLIDTSNFAKVACHKWHVTTGGYASTNIIKDGKQRTMLMHVYLFPHIAEPRDHLNKKKLDNRAENIVPGANGVNVRNANYIGVYEQEDRHRYEVCWTRFGATIQSRKCFSWNTTRSNAAAKAAADKFYAEQSQAALAQAREHNRIHGPETPIIRQKPVRARVTNLGIPGLRIVRQDTKYPALRTSVVISGTTYDGYYPLSNFADRAAIIEFGIKWLEDTRAAHPKLPRKKRVLRKKKKTKIGSDDDDDELE